MGINNAPELVNKEEQKRRKNQNELRVILDDLPSDNEAKVELVLAMSGLKRATDFQFSYEEGEPKEITDKNEKKAKEFFEKSGLNYVENNREFAVLKHWKEYIVGEKREDVIRFQELWNKDDDFGSQSAEMGELLGFPKTSIDAYVKKDKILKSDFPDNIKKEEYVAFANIAFSKDNYMKELETVKKWANTIKSFSPKLYNAVVKQYREELGEEGDSHLKETNNLPEEKQKLWKKKISELQTPDEYGYVIDAGIVETIAALQLLGINTTQSDQGNYSTSPWIQFEAEEPKNFFIGEETRKIDIMNKLKILPEEIDKKSAMFNRDKQVDVEDEARSELLQENNSYTPEYQKWQTETLAMVKKLENLIDEFYKKEPIPDGSKDLRIIINFPYRSPQYKPYIKDTPFLQVGFNGDEPKFTSEEERLEIVSRTRNEMKRFSKFLKEKALSL